MTYSQRNSYRNAKKRGHAFGFKNLPQESPTRSPLARVIVVFFSHGVKPKFGKESISTGLGSLMEETAARIGREQVEVLGADVESRLQDNLGVRYRGNES